MFDDLSDVTKESLTEAWANLGRLVEGAKDVEGMAMSCSSAQSILGFDSAMLALSAAVNNGYGPTAASTGVGEYFDGVAGYNYPATQELFASELHSSIMGEIRGIESALGDLSGKLGEAADELSKIAEAAGDASSEAALYASTHSTML